MKKLPAFQFYPGDIQKDPGYKRCSKAERGAFLDFMLLIHECAFPGAAWDNGSAMSLEEIALAIGGDKAENLQLLDGLVTKGPIKVWSKVTSKVELNTEREDLCPDFPDGMLYNRRMVRDSIKRFACSIAGKEGGGNPALKSTVTNAGTYKGLPIGDDKGEAKGKMGSSSSSSSSNREEKEEERIPPLASLGPQGLGDKGTESNVAYSGKQRERKVFVIPGLEDVEAYCIEAGLNEVDAASFIDFYASKGWKVGKTPMSDWQAAARGWQRKAKARPIPLGEQGGKNGAHTQHRPGRYESVAQHSGRVVRELLDDISHGEPSP